MSTADKPITVLLADDHPVVRAGLRAVLESAEDIRVIGEAETAAEAVEFVRNALHDTGVDLVLMDLRFGDSPSSGSRAGGVDATAQIRGITDAPLPAPQVLVVTNYSSDSDVLGAITAGAVGYLLKDADPKELIDGIRAAAKGETVLNTQVASRLMGRMRNPSTSLTSREIEVLELVAQGSSNKKIAQTLVLTEATVKSHLVHIFAKLNVNSRTAAVAKAQDLGILGF